MYANYLDKLHHSVHIKLTNFNKNNVQSDSFEYNHEYFFTL